MRNTGLITGAIVLACAGATLAQGQSTTNKGNLPNGKPFQHIQTQFAAMDQRIVALQTQVNDVESRLQAQIDAISGTLTNLQAQVTTLKAQITTVPDGVSALQKSVADNQTAIEALTQAVSSLQSALADAKAATASNTGDIAGLQAQVANIQTLLDVHESRITSLEQANSQINQFLANMVNATCQAGQAISDIGPGGIIQCSSTSGGSGPGTVSITTIAASSYLVPGALNNILSLSCPADSQMTGSGYWLPTSLESVQLVSNVGSIVIDNVAYPMPTFAYVKYNPIFITSRTLSQRTSVISVQYQSNTGGFAQTWGAYANCIKVQ